ncbi:MAG: hypothetical protein PWP37_1023 [Thermotogota bacterium]|nr:hypothetical protein [Thermotogota bacterium]
MAKKRTVYVCDNCGYESPKWFGRCPSCGEWNTAKQFSVESETKSERTGELSQPVSILEVPDTESERISTGFVELDRILGGGLVPGSVVLIGGEPGIGKSTLMMQVSASMALRGNVYYVSGEESPAQLKSRARRLNALKENIYLSSEPVVDRVTKRFTSPVLVVFDSLQTLRLSTLETFPGSVSQIRDSVMKVMELAKGMGVPVFLVGHVTKEGQIAGPKLVEHLVDVVIYFEGERREDLRILRTTKNRFGPSGEVALFEMTDTGLREITNPSFILPEGLSGAPGAAFGITVEGTRPICIEVQALVSKMQFGTPRRTALGLDPIRMTTLSAVLSRHLKLPLEYRDIYASVIGGLRVTDPATDLAMAGAMLSSFFDIPLPPSTVLVGEISLDGSVRAPSNILKRLRAAEASGFERAWCPAMKDKSTGIDVIEINSVKDLGRLVTELARG